jgi:NAD(P)-dependent dehydrogenase (short-subunit alcohol dehydrogenase family)
MRTYPGDQIADGGPAMFMRRFRPSGAPSADALPCRQQQSQKHHPQGRRFGHTGQMGEPDDVARAAVYLASDAVNMVTGHGLYIVGEIPAM